MRVSTLKWSSIPLLVEAWETYKRESKLFDADAIYWSIGIEEGLFVVVEKEVTED